MMKSAYRYALENFVNNEEYRIPSECVCKKCGFFKGANFSLEST